VAAFYLDSDVSVRLAPWLRVAGHDAVTSGDQGHRQATDDEQLLIAAQQGRIVLTHNRKDFVLLHDAWRRWPLAWGFPAQAHNGILVLDQHSERELAAVVDEFVTMSATVVLGSALYWWRHRSGWHHQLTDRRWVPYR
jgi:Domain of unknown function (DUF5615)